MKIWERIKKYEFASRTILLPRSYILLRIDWKAFHTFTKDMGKPFDDKLIECMVKAWERTAKEMMGFVIWYHQSDEFTFCITDLESFESQVWFWGEVQKLCSVTASMFWAYFNKEMWGTEAIFDCRAFNVPNDDVPNVFIWRQRDWERNSLQMFARDTFTHKELNNKKKWDMHEMLHEQGKNWAKLQPVYKNGTFITKDGRRVNDKLTYSEISHLLSPSL